MNTNNQIDISKLNKADVLAALYNASKPQGLGILHCKAEVMTREQAEHLLERDDYFYYLQGRVMKVQISGDKLDPWGFDRDNGQGAALRALQPLMDLLPA